MNEGKYSTENQQGYIAILEQSCMLILISLIINIGQLMNVFGFLHNIEQYCMS